MPTPPLPPRGHLPRLEPAWYRGGAVVFWTHTVALRRQGWLNTTFHAAFREIMLHAAVFLRTQLAPQLSPARWQHQPHDHVLRDAERQRGAFVDTCT